MRLRTIAVALSAVPMIACGRSQHDRELDRIFAHQSALRDTTGAIQGLVLEVGSEHPIPGAHASTAYLGDMATRDGSFTIEYLGRGIHQLQVGLRGYQDTILPVHVEAKDTTRVIVRLRRAPVPCCILVGRWRIRMTLDSAGALARPSGRETSGEIALRANDSHAPGMAEVTDPYVREAGGIFDIDFTPFWGGQVAPDISTTVFGPAGPSLLTEAAGAAFHADSISVVLIPRMSHGGVSLQGRFLREDSISGEWYQNAYCCGAQGSFQMWRTARDPGPIPIPESWASPPPPSDTLPTAERGDIRVRVWDDALQAYVHGRHWLDKPGEWYKGSYTLGTESDGWGPTFWLPPGKYGIVIEALPCGTDTYRLRKRIRQTFEAMAGVRTDVEIRIDSRRVRMARTFNNTEGRPCLHPTAPSDSGGA